MIDRRTLVAGTALALACPTAARSLSPSSPIRFAAEEFPTDPRFNYAIELISAGLAALSDPRRPVRVTGMNQRRIRRALADGNVDLAILPSLSLNRARLPHIPYPIRRGLLGLRLLVARSDEAQEIGAVTRLEELKRLRLAMAPDWVETPVFAGLGFNVVEAPYPALFDMLRAGRADYTSRAVSEVWGELAASSVSGPDLSVAPGLALFYPLDDYFVSSIAARPMLEKLLGGLRKIVADGSAWQIFNRHYAGALTRTGLAQRRILQVSGFGVDPGTPLGFFNAIELTPSAGVFNLPNDRSIPPIPAIVDPK